MDPGIREQVFSFQDVEEEPYTICRWLRTTKFNAETLLRKLQDNQAHFATAQAQNFYPKISKAIGIVPYSVFLSQWPFLPIGKAKNGCPVNYFQAGKIHPEGVLACTTPQEMEGYFWWSFMYKFKDHLRRAQARDENFVRMEGINVIDLQGLSSDSLSGEAMDVMKLSAKISDFFPGVRVVMCRVSLLTYGVDPSHQKNTHPLLLRRRRRSSSAFASLHSDFTLHAYSQCTFLL